MLPQNLIRERKRNYEQNYFLWHCSLNFSKFLNYKLKRS